MMWWNSGSIQEMITRSVTSAAQSGSVMNRSGSLRTYLTLSSFRHGDSLAYVYEERLLRKERQRQVVSYSQIPLTDCIITARARGSGHRGHLILQEALQLSSALF